MNELEFLFKGNKVSRIKSVLVESIFNDHWRILFGNGESDFELDRNDDYKTLYIVNVLNVTELLASNCFSLKHFY